VGSPDTYLESGGKGLGRRFNLTEGVDQYYIPLGWLNVQVNIFKQF